MIVVTLKYKGIVYEVKDKHAAYGIDAAEHHWTEGNYGCDCNKSLFIQRQCDDDFPEMECGETIELIRIAESIDAGKE